MILTNRKGFDGLLRLSKYDFDEEKMTFLSAGNAFSKRLGGPKSLYLYKRIVNSIGKKFHQPDWETGGYRRLTRLANTLILYTSFTIN